MKTFNLILRFLLELSMLAALAYWGFNASQDTFVSLLLGLLAPFVAILLWWVFVAPKARQRLSDPERLFVEIILFAAAALGLLAAGQPILGLVFSVLVAVNLGLMFVFGQRGM
jgi:hypothetical protein